MEEQRKPFRRRKKWQGAVWTPAAQPALRPDGAWCRSCKTRHGYMTMGIAYERRKIGGKYAWIILWSCKKTGNVIEEMELGLNKAGVSNIDNSTESEDESTQPAEE